MFLEFNFVFLYIYRIVEEFHDFLCEKMKMIVGATDWTEYYTTDDEFSPILELDIKRAIQHPDYQDQYLYYDVALIETKEEIPFGYEIQPVCLPEEPSLNLDSRNKDHVTLVGYGRNIR